ncbi:hypothetical protein AB6D11_03020 [Vibrio splendidus]
MKDLTRCNLFEADETLERVRRPKPLRAKQEGANIILTSIDEKLDQRKPKRLHVAVLKARFLSWGKDDIVYLPSMVCRFQRQKTAFMVTDLAEGHVEQGKAGDYLVTKSSGLNMVVSREQFNEEFISTKQLDALLKQDPVSYFYARGKREPSNEPR